MIIDPRRVTAVLASARLVHSFWALACALDVDVWFEFVYSEANVADWPSRGLVAWAADLSARVVRDFVLPPTAEWGSVEDALTRASLSNKRRRKS